MVRYGKQPSERAMGRGFRMQNKYYLTFGDGGVIEEEKDRKTRSLSLIFSFSAR